VKTAIKDATKIIFVFIPFTCRFPARDLFNFYSKCQVCDLFTRSAKATFNSTFN